jgi:hypothetical protein
MPHQSRVKFEHTSSYGVVRLTFVLLGLARDIGFHSIKNAHSLFQEILACVALHVSIVVLSKVESVLLLDGLKRRPQQWLTLSFGVFWHFGFFVESCLGCIQCNLSNFDSLGRCRQSNLQIGNLSLNVVFSPP